eukprot:CAMPEP_0204203862 /NCGR_PEP_ID=MMETSP0361-20130328/69232_1 /ASSEMBLY_ACC=CAM_ASM_000343 /TAXON_ID=268821 /ORGANISM="Scrippsiella Hangoei, Strain SHTV-5" /LENGTH=60 /DNA_ID=CAMNT_0051166887 /DNA_START=87 /DNA_END=266 /DNA_ORIENTATION=-
MAAKLSAKSGDYSVLSAGFLFNFQDGLETLRQTCERVCCADHYTPIGNAPHERIPRCELK